MVVNESTKVSEQLQRLGLVSTFTDPYRCILQNPDDETDIVLVQPNADGNTPSPSTNLAMTIPTMKSSVNATVCVRDTPHFLYMVQSK